MPKLSGIQWTLLICILLCLAAWFAMLAPWILNAETRTNIAMENGMYVRILTENGEIQGKPITPSKTAAPETSPKPVTPVAIEEPAPPATPKPEQASSPTEAKPEDKPSEQAPPAEQKPVTTTPETIHETEKETQTNPHAAPVATVTITDTTPSTATEAAQSTNEGQTPPTIEEFNTAPNTELLEEYKGKSLPIISKEGLRPSHHYARPDSTPKDAPSISLTISGLGLNEKLTLQAINELPANISLSFSPYAKNLETWFEKAKKAGHETWIDIPMEYADYPANDPGPLGLLKGKPEEENIIRLKNTLSSVTGYVGVIAPKDEIFTGYAMMHAMNNELAKRGLLLLLRSRAFKPDTDAEGVLYSSRSLIKEKSHAEIIQSLQDLEIIAKDYGYAIGVVDTSASLLTLLKEWQKDLIKRNTYLIPLSAVPHRRK